MFSSSIPIIPYVLSISCSQAASGQKWHLYWRKIHEVGWERAMDKSFLLWQKRIESNCLFDQACMEKNREAVGRDILKKKEALSSCPNPLPFLIVIPKPTNKVFTMSLCCCLSRWPEKLLHLWITKFFNVNTPGGTTYTGLYGEALPERGTFFRFQVYWKVRFHTLKCDCEKKKTRKLSGLVIKRWCNSQQLREMQCSEQVLERGTIF